MFGRNYNNYYERVVSKEEYSASNLPQSAGSTIKEEGLHDSFNPDCICNPTLTIQGDNHRNIQHKEIRNRIANENNLLLKEILEILKEKPGLKNSISEEDYNKFLNLKDKN